MPTIRVEMFPGRSAEQKRALVSELTAGTVRALGVPASAVEVQLFEVARDAWAVGCVLHSDRQDKPPPAAP
jgi:4-oxalocrotonate tautomerase